MILKFSVSDVLKKASSATAHNKTLLLSVTIFGVVGFTVLWLQLPNKLTATVPPLTDNPPVIITQSLHSPSRLLPLAYWEHRRNHPDNYTQVSCSNLPKLEDIHYAAASWQHLKLLNGNVYVYGAYWDNRFEEPLVRVLIYCDVTPLPTLMCQFWYEDENSPLTVPTTVTYGWRREWGGLKDGVNEPYILACRARRHSPEKQRAPAAVSIVTEDTLCGTPTNVLRVQGAPVTDAPLPPLNTSKISVCLKWLHFQNDISAELVEWIELIKAFGAAKLFVFELQSHPNIRRVLDYYEATGFADVTKFAHTPQLRSTFSPHEQDFHDFRRELLPLNDCLYRSINEYQWMTPIDSDEIIVPYSYDTWQNVIAAETKGNVNGLDAMAFRNYYFLDPAQKDLAAPPYMKILGHLWRGREPNPIGHNVKSFHNTSSVVAMHNHYPITCGNSRSCWSSNVNETVGRLHHYRSRCKDNQSDCPALHVIVRDNTTTRWHHLVKKVDRILDNLGIRPNIQGNL